MGQLQNALIQRKLRSAAKVLDVTPAPSMAPEVVPVIIVEDLSGAIPEAPQYEIPGIVRQKLVAVAAQYTYIVFHNPAGSGQIVELTSALILASGGSGILVGYNTGNYPETTGAKGRSRNYSAGVLPPKLSQFLSERNDANANLLEEWWVQSLPATLTEVPLGVTLAEGQTCGFRSGSVNESLDITVYYLVGHMPE